MRAEIFPSFSSRENAVEWGLKIIELAVYHARARYLTLTAGQEAAYAAKLKDAQAFLADQDNPSSYPWIAFEAAATARTPLETAQSIVAAAERWQNVTGPQIEAARIAGKLAIESAGSVPDLCRATRAAEREINQI